MAPAVGDDRQPSPVGTGGAQQEVQEVDRPIRTATAGLPLPAGRVHDLKVPGEGPGVERAARAPAALSPTVRSTTGLPASLAAWRLRTKRRPSRNSSMYSTIARVASFRVSSSISSHASTSIWLPSETARDTPRPRRDASRPSSRHMFPLCETMPIAPSTNVDPRSRSSVSRVEHGHAVGTDERAPASRTRRTIRRSCSRPAGPISPNPAVIPIRKRAPAARASSTAASKAGTGTVIHDHLRRFGQVARRRGARDARGSRPRSGSPGRPPGWSRPCRAERDSQCPHLAGLAEAPTMAIERGLKSRAQVAAGARRPGLRCTVAVHQARWRSTPRLNSPAR